MWRRSARRLVLGLLSGLLAGVVVAQSAPPAPVTPHQLRQAMAHALSTGQDQAALALALTLLRQDQRDPTAHYALAVLHARHGDLSKARKSARMAFRHSGSDVQSFASANLSAKLAFQDRSYTWSQYWLRRAYSNAADLEQRRVVERDFKTVRARNPLRFNITASMTPSSNVNNGSISRFMIIEGVPVIGVNSGDAMALSGVEATLNARFSYRLHQTQFTETRAVSRLYTRQVMLSDEAKAQAPGAKGSDYSFTQFEGGLRHAFKTSKDGPVWSVGGVLGRAWYGGDHLHDLVRVEAGGNFRLSHGRSVSVSASREWRRAATASWQRDVHSSLSAGFSQVTPKGNSYSLGLSLNETDDATPIFSNQGVVARISYGFGKPVGPVRITTALNMGFSDYPDYRVGLIPVPGGRQDSSISGEVALTFHRMQYAGFSPVMTIRALETHSNVSRFDTRELSVNFSIRSSF